MNSVADDNDEKSRQSSNNDNEQEGLAGAGDNTKRILVGVALAIVTLVALGIIVVLSIGASNILTPTAGERAALAHNEESDGPFRLHAKILDGDTGAISYVNLPGETLPTLSRKANRTKKEWRRATGDRRPIVLLLHGIKTDSCLYPPLIRRYWSDPRGLLFVCPDLLGHGLSPWPSCALTIERHVAALDRLVQQIGFFGNDVHIVGMSLGALLALELTAHLVRTGRAPTTTSLLATPYFESKEQANQAARDHSGWYRHRKCAQFACRYLLCRQSWFWRHALKAHFRRLYPDAPYDVLSGALTHSARGIESCVDDCVMGHRPMAAAQTVAQARVPTLLIDGTDDRLCNSTVRSALRRDLPGSVSLQLPSGAGHDFVISQPSPTWRAIETFINVARLAAPPRSITIDE